MQASQSCTTFLSLGVSRVNRLLPFSPDYRQAPDRRKSFSIISEGAGLVHDAGNLLGALGIYADLLAEPGVLSDECKAYAEEIRLIASRSHRLLERLIFCTTESEALANQHTTVLEAVEGYKEFLSNVVERHIKFSINPFTNCPIRLPREVVERILLNLVKNAAAATSAEDEIEVSVQGARMPGRCGRKYISLIISDNGTGMSQCELKRLRDNLRPVTKSGRGMGFRIVQELAATSDGYLEIDSAPGKGTRVSVRWFQK